MTRTSVNLAVLAGSAATLVASMAGIARSEGYFESVAKDATVSVAPLAPSETLAETGPPYGAAAADLEIGALVPMAVIRLSPARSLSVPPIGLDVTALTRIDGTYVQATSAASTPAPRTVVPVASSSLLRCTV